ncbi:diguanylate cyclase (GGDEF) domain-containing protein [Sanguibacter gelidistatuariae]|uniref:Diguanylate cyclase (GGDEF) domain-containing protein n=1 Tax=Sanguibacter gelidistatuariae TaxID=1814289 RepID=A0A1G6H6L3_9MICO|nr:diguanylate cyclase [Sanguibacter gelidistatuariae]SDB89871.1 diguanylate cyclase (GGDEF) domain-containing protein [Sanguibacter gelidistatuariae]
MTLDPQTLSVATGIVVLTAGMVFVLETIFRRDSTTSRLWSLAYLAGILTSVSYMLWATLPTAWWAVAVGNGAFVVSAGAIWSGCRSFNGRRSLIGVVLLAGALAAGAVVLDGPDGGEWAGAHVWLLGVGTFSALGVAETFTRSMRRDINARGLSVVLIAEGVLFLTRFVVLVGWGTEHVVFSTYLGTTPMSVVTIVLMIVAAVTMSVMRSEAGPRARMGGTARVFSRRGLINVDVLEQVLDDCLARAAESEEAFTLLHLHLDDLEEIGIAFGRSAADLVLDEYAATVRRVAPVSAIIGEAGAGRLLVAVPGTAPGEEITLATVLRRALLDVVVPEAPGAKVTASIGAATTHRLGYDVAQLSRAARAASDEATAAGGNRVASAEVRGGAVSEAAASGPAVLRES